MAKQAGPFFFTGTIGDVIFYKSGGQYLMRMKGDYNKKRMQKPGAYPLMQLRQQEFGQASKLASKVYRTLLRSQKKQGLFGEMTQRARKLLRENKGHEEVVAALQLLYKKGTISPKQTVEASRVAATSIEKKVVSHGKMKEKMTLYPQAIPVGAMLLNGQVYFPLKDYQILTKPSSGYGESSLE